ncbi:hypothetical protein AB4K20DRAFT_1906114 [Rhizopus microsporus]
MKLYSIRISMCPFLLPLYLPPAIVFYTTYMKLSLWEFDFDIFFHAIISILYSFPTLISLKEKALSDRKRITTRCRKQ